MSSGSFSSHALHMHLDGAMWARSLCSFDFKTAADRDSITTRWKKFKSQGSLSVSFLLLNIVIL